VFIRPNFAFLLTFSGFFAGIAVQPADISAGSSCLENTRNLERRSQGDEIVKNPRDRLLRLERRVDFGGLDSLGPTARAASQPTGRLAAAFTLPRIGPGG
jgi:hypothetical protein